MILVAVVVFVVCGTILVLTYVKAPSSDPEPPMYAPDPTRDGAPGLNPEWVAWKDRQKAKAGRSWLDILMSWANDLLGAVGGTKTLFWILLILLGWFIWKHRHEIKVPRWLRSSS